MLVRSAQGGSRLGEAVTRRLYRSNGGLRFANPPYELSEC